MRSLSRPTFRKLSVLAIAVLVLTLAGTSVPVVRAYAPSTAPANPVVLDYIGHASIRIKTPGDLRIISDPYAGHPSGLNDFPRRMAADIVTVSHAHPDHNNVSAVFGTPEIFFIPGIYQVGDVIITGYASDHGLINGKSQGSNIVFVYEIGSIKIVHLGAAGLVTQPDILAALKSADVVILDIVGDSSHPVKEQIDQLLELKVRTILPAHYSYENEVIYYGAETLSQFLKVLPTDLVVVKQGSTLEVTANMPQQVVIVEPFANQKK